jgi:hypothetical protein
LIEQYQGEIALIRYHTPGDPFYEYNPEENAERIDYYDGTSNSHLFIDGIVDAGYWHEPWEDDFLARMEVESPLEITIGGSYDSESRYADLDISVTATDEITQSDLRLQCVTIENGIYWQAPNGLEIHNQTMRDMIPDGQGETFSIENGQTVDFVRRIHIDGELNADSCEMVVFVQAHQAREVLQASKVKIPDLIETMVDEKPGELPSALRLYPSYPNPFNAKTKILYDLIEASEVSVEIYNVIGQQMACLFSGIQQAGEHSIIWDASGFPSGIYFARLEAGELSKSVKMVLLR